MTEEQTEEQKFRAKLEKAFSEKISENEWYAAEFLAASMLKQTDQEVFNDLLKLGVAIKLEPL